MKIIYFSPHPNLYLSIPSGPGVHMREMMHAMTELGHTIVPLIMGGLEQPTGLEDEAISSIHPRKKKLRNQLKRLVPAKLWQTAKDVNLLRFDRYAQRQLEAVVKREQPDLIYERGFYLSTAGVHVADKFGVQHILELNAPYPEERASMEGPSFLDFLGKMHEKTQLRMTHRVVVVSTALRDYVETRVVGTAHKTVVTPNAIRSDFAPPADVAVDAQRKKLNLEGKQVIGFIGSIFPYHGVDRLIEAFGRLCNDHANLALLIVGDGAVLPELKKQAEVLECAADIVFTGRVPHHDAAMYVSLMHICVMPHSNWYGSPVKVFEYGALGKTIVAPDLSPIRDVITSGLHGVIVKNNDLYRSLHQCIESPELTASMARAFNEKVYKEHTWIRMAERALR
ncbi:MAG: glycosyltransferase family 4 protein [Flavobacteriales bacterium]